jgi:Flp pilus assembly CpaE family ATPase
MKQRVTRRAKRYPVHLEVKELNGQPVADTLLIDISTMGARLETTTPLALKSRVEFSFYLPDADSETRLAGVVVWVQPAAGKPGSHHIGVEFHSSFFFKTSGATARPEDSMGSVENTHLVSFLGSKGGVGNTFLTINVAYLLAKEKKGKVLVLDLDLLYGQSIYFFDAQPKYTIIDLIENFEHLDRLYLQSLLHNHSEYLSLLPAPARLEEAETVTPVQVNRILHYLKNLKVFRWIILDCYHQVGEVTLTALESSDDIFLVTAPSLTALYNAKRLLNLLNLLDLPDSRISVILNYLRKHQSLSESEVANFLGQEISYKIGFDPVNVDHSIDEGQPLAAMASRVAASMGLNTIANSLVGEDKLRANSRWGRIGDLLKKP